MPITGFWHIVEDDLVVLYDLEKVREIKARVERDGDMLNFTCWQNLKSYYGDSTYCAFLVDQVP